MLTPCYSAAQNAAVLSAFHNPVYNMKCNVHGCRGKTSFCVWPHNPSARCAVSSPAFRLPPGPQQYATVAWTVRVTFEPGRQDLATSLGRALQSSPGAVLAAFQSTRGPATVTQLYYGLP